MTPGGTSHGVGHGDKRPRRLSLFAAALMTHGSIAEAAKSCGISKRTGIRWMQNHPEIAARLRQAGQEAWACASGQIQLGSLESVECLRRLIRTAKNESVQAAACRTLLELGQKVIELDQIQQRLERLEQIVRSGKGAYGQHFTAAGTVGKTNGLT